ncbi:MAG: FkbM family methyltransferase [Bacteroidota bacterium]|nr:FkbM family methyltransferase [Bacteroidota bacterium]
MNLNRFLKKCGKGLDVIFLKAKASYSQAGEDIIVDFLFGSLKIAHPTYLEIGTNQPKICNNTYNFYKRGCAGVCIEPDLGMVKHIRRQRPRDTILNIGIGITDQENAEFYLFPGLTNGWSTFSKEEAEIRKRDSGIGYQTLSVPLVSINTIMSKYFKPYPNFISLDVEGLDLEILKSIDYAKFRPEVICVETITFGYLNNSEKKITAIAEFMRDKGYFEYADTHINTIFCRKDLFDF